MARKRGHDARGLIQFGKEIMVSYRLLASVCALVLVHGFAFATEPSPKGALPGIAGSSPSIRLITEPTTIARPDGSVTIYHSVGSNVAKREPYFGSPFHCPTGGWNWTCPQLDAPGAKATKTDEGLGGFIHFDGTEQWVGFSYFDAEVDGVQVHRMRFRYNYGDRRSAPAARMRTPGLHQHDPWCRC